MVYVEKVLEVIQSTVKVVLTGYTRNPAYRCNRCQGLKHPINGSISERFNLAVGIDLGIFDSFCYLGDTIDARGGCEASVTARIRAAWGKFRQLLPLLTSRGLSLHTRGKIYSTYIRPFCCIPVKVGRLLCTTLPSYSVNDRCMTRWICNTKPYETNNQRR